MIGGETLVFTGDEQPADVWAAYWDLMGRGSGLSNSQQIAAMHEHVKRLLEPEYRDAWERVALSATFTQLDGIINHIWQTQTRRPTGAPSDSSGRRAADTTPSTEGSQLAASTSARSD